MTRRPPQLDDRWWGADPLSTHAWPRWGLRLAGLMALLACLMARPVAASPAEQRTRARGAGGDQSQSTDMSAGTTASQLLDEPFATPRQLLRLLDIGPSDLDSFVDGEAITSNDEEAFLKVLFRLPQIGDAETARWAHTSFTWPTIATTPAAWRGEILAFEGRARSLVRRQVGQPWSGLFELDHYWEVEIGGVGSGTVTVFARVVPEAWSKLAPLNERCQVRGLFLKLGPPGDAGHHFLLAAGRVAWLPDAARPAVGIGPSQLYLAGLGMDIGLFDTVRERHGKPLSAAERACFYQLLHALQQASTPALARRARAVQLGPLLQHPEALQGEILRVEGSIRRVTRVVVNDADIRGRLGITHYYQLDVLVPLRDAEVQITSDSGGKAGPVYRTSFPFTCVSMSLAPEWTSLIGKERVNISATLPGVFLKNWAYANPYVASFDERQRQISPLLVIHQPVGARSTTDQGPWPIVLGTAFLAALAGLWLAVWYLGRADRRRSRLRTRRPGPPPESFVPPPPDDATAP